MSDRTAADQAPADRAPADRSLADHGIRSRSEAGRIEAERWRLNDAVRDAARGRVRFDEEPASFLPMLAALADPLPPAAATPPAGAAGMAPLHTAAAAAVPSSVGGGAVDALLDGDLRSAAQAIRAGRTTAAALLEAVLVRIAGRDPTLGAVVRLRTEAARDAARRRDADAAAGRWRGPLHGVPLLHKDCLARPGEPMQVGSRVDGPRSGGQRATLLERLDAAGAIDLGAVNLNEMVAGPTGQNPWFGDCRNPYDPDRISGGSSSGSATAVAGGLVHASFGSDTGGSIRLPASMSGLVGVKPTYGRVSRAGCFPRAWSLDCAGPLARTAADAALLLGVVAGPDPRDPTTLAAPVPDYLAAIDGAADGSRFAVLRTGVDLHPDVAAAFDRFVAAAGRRFEARAAVESALLPVCYAMADTISKVEAATLHGEWMRTQPEHFSQAVYSRTEPGLHLPAVRYLETLSTRAGILRDFVAGAFTDADVLVLPTVPIPVPTRAEADMEGQGKVFAVVGALTALTRPFSFLGLPVVSMPVGRDGNGMPIGVQLVGRPLAEARLLAMAHRLMADLNWYPAAAPWPPRSGGDLR